MEASGLHQWKLLLAKEVVETLVFISTISCILFIAEPGRVKNLLATPLSPNEVQVTWNPPADTSGPVEGYDVSYHLRHRLACPDEEPTDVNRNRIIRYSGRNLTYTFKDLLPYSEYEVKVRAGGTEPGPEEMQSAQTPQKCKKLFFIIFCK